EHMRARLAAALGIPIGVVSVKAKTTDRLGIIGDGSAVAAMAVALIEG
ncbi:MAG: 2-C-methyl-D-erythritol 2,4-cyclodiphosphate synthase, partial [Acidimicrobiia bacterium]|nr:2-C-methyl-D-erythritol 2,4-cyclodiphosphate synthase [Acidimicrobiia bacterium]NNL28301.1 bifunctional 2-C-methyl-D-erythritol 4-phosphate cytidylyltransferase/2-C-methyl-D-erythritol 2,4-cyclodiphosphate synthase [Acidimicrobiia bacterium]